MHQTTLIGLTRLAELSYKADCWEAYRAGQYQTEFYLWLAVIVLFAAVIWLGLELRYERRKRLEEKAENKRLDELNKELHLKADDAERAAAVDRETVEMLQRMEMR